MQSRHEPRLRAGAGVVVSQTSARHRVLERQEKDGTRADSVLAHPKEGGIRGIETAAGGAGGLRSI
jgi:hypothetical protein